MNQNIKRLISSILAVAVGFSGNNVIGHAEGDAMQGNSAQAMQAELAQTDVTIEEAAETEKTDASPAVYEAKIVEEKTAANEEQPTGTQQAFLTGKSWHNSYLELEIKRFNEILRKYRSLKTQEEKQAYAQQKYDELYKEYRELNDCYNKTERYKKEERLKALDFVMDLLACMKNGEPYVEQLIEELAAIEKEFNSRKNFGYKMKYVRKAMFLCRKEIGQLRVGDEKKMKCLKARYLQCLGGDTDEIIGGTIYDNITFFGVLFGIVVF